MRWDLIIYDETRWATAVVNLKGKDEMKHHFWVDLLKISSFSYTLTTPHCRLKKNPQITCNWTRKKAAERWREYFEPWQYILDHPDKSQYSSKTSFLLLFLYCVFFVRSLLLLFNFILARLSLSPLCFFFLVLFGFLPHFSVFFGLCPPFQLRRGLKTLTWVISWYIFLLNLKKESLLLEI